MRLATKNWAILLRGAPLNAPPKLKAHIGPRSIPDMLGPLIMGGNIRQIVLYHARQLDTTGLAACLAFTCDRTYQAMLSQVLRNLVDRCQGEETPHPTHLALADYCLSHIDREDKLVEACIYARKPEMVGASCWAHMVGVPLHEEDDIPGQSMPNTTSCATWLAGQGLRDLGPKSGISWGRTWTSYIFKHEYKPNTPRNLSPTHRCLCCDANGRQ